MNFKKKVASSQIMHFQQLGLAVEHVFSPTTRRSESREDEASFEIIKLLQQDIKLIHTYCNSPFAHDCKEASDQ